MLLGPIAQNCQHLTVFDFQKPTGNFPGFHPILRTSKASHHTYHPLQLRFTAFFWTPPAPLWSHQLEVTCSFFWTQTTLSTLFSTCITLFLGFLFKNMYTQISCWDNHIKVESRPRTSMSPHSTMPGINRHSNTCCMISYFVIYYHWPGNFTLLPITLPFKILIDN